jgi:hypothetical protein
MNVNSSPPPQQVAPVLLLSILPYHHLSATGAFGTITNPGLVSPTDSQPGLRKELLPSLPVTTHSAPNLQNYALGGGIVKSEESAEPAPIIPRPPGKSSSSHSQHHRSDCIL